jgi:hypothetical protein
MKFFLILSLLSLSAIAQDKYVCDETATKSDQFKELKKWNIYVKHIRMDSSNSSITFVNDKNTKERISGPLLSYEFKVNDLTHTSFYIPKSLKGPYAEFTFSQQSDLQYLNATFNLVKSNAKGEYVTYTCSLKSVVSNYEQ